MPTLDAISTPKRQRKRVRHAAPVQKQHLFPVRRPPFPVDPATRRRQRAMYAMIGFIMVVLFVIWLATFRASLHQQATTANPFSGIVQKIGELFKGPQQSATANTNTADQERLRELRGYVFPEFKDAK